LERPIPALEARLRMSLPLQSAIPEREKPQEHHKKTESPIPETQAIPSSPMHGESDS
jgi:hypothetical protein